MRNAKEVIKLLESLRKGQTVAYYTGETGWLGEQNMWVLLAWLERVNKLGIYDFTQKKLLDGGYQYLARKRITPKPMFRV